MKVVHVLIWVCLEIWHCVLFDDLAEGDVTTQSDYYITIEEQELVHICYPNLMSGFELLNMAKKTTKKGTQIYNDVGIDLGGGGCTPYSISML